MPLTSKRCSRCGEDKPAEAFSPDLTKTSGLKSSCKACRRAPAAEPSPTLLETMRPYATDLEREGLDALLAAGSVDAAAERLGMPPRRLRGLLSELERRSAARGWSPASDMVTPQPDGFHVKGVSTFYGPDGEIRGQWVKTRRDSSQLEMLLDAMQGITEPFRGFADPVPAPEAFDDDLLTIYPFGDPHFGLYAWAEEAGEDFDLKIAERDLVDAVDHLVDLAPPSRYAIIAPLGDNMHADSSRNTTTAGTVVDTDTRWSKVFGVLLRGFRRCIDRALLKHERVKVICLNGNHDENVSLVLAHCLAALYEREPRVEVDLSPSKFRWHKFGANLFGFTHGDTCKKDALPGVMACDQPQWWGETRYRYFYIGHFHHEQVKEYPGCTVESFRTLAAKDAWHAAHGYRSLQSMTCDVWHRDWGKVVRHSVGIAQVRSRSRR